MEGNYGDSIRGYGREVQVIKCRRIYFLIKVGGAKRREQAQRHGAAPDQSTGLAGTASQEELSCTFPDQKGRGAGICQLDEQASVANSSATRRPFSFHHLTSSRSIPFRRKSLAVNSGARADQLQEALRVVVGLSLVPALTQSREVSSTKRTLVPPFKPKKKIRTRQTKKCPKGRGA